MATLQGRGGGPLLCVLDRDGRQFQFYGRGDHKGRDGPRHACVVTKPSFSQRQKCLNSLKSLTKTAIF
jgi:hypothetical protein